MSCKYIFIGGVERSGTTLLAQMMVNRGFGISAPETIFKEKWLSTGSFASVKNHWRFKRVWQLENVKIHGNDISQDFNELFVAYNNLNYDPGRFIDHTPHNCKLAKRLQKEFKDAVFIHIVRDPRAIYNSFRKLDWGPKTALRTAFYWMGSILHIEYELRMSGAKHITIKYEELLENPDMVMDKISKELKIGQIEIDDVEFNLPAYTGKQHSLVNGRLEQDRRFAGNLISNKDKIIIEKFCAPIMVKYGYVVDTDLELFMAKPLSYSNFLLFLYSFFVEVVYWPKSKLKNYIRRYLSGRNK